MVNTQFPRPHGTSDITSIAFSSAMAGVAGTPYLITSATDGSAKLWQVRQARKSEHGESLFLTFSSAESSKLYDDQQTHNLRSTVAFGDVDLCSAILTLSHSCNICDRSA